MKSQAINWDKIFAKHVLNKRLVSRIYIKNSNLNSKKLENGQDVIRHFNEDMQMANKRCST